MVVEKVMMDTGTQKKNDFSGKGQGDSDFPEAISQAQRLSCLLQFQWTRSACRRCPCRQSNELESRGAQPKMRDTVFAGQIQRMVFSADDMPFPDLLGQPEGICRVLMERGLWVEGIKKRCVKKKGEPSTCKKGKTCAFRILEAQPDFANEISLLETTIRNLGHECIFYPKFHCEFNFMEIFWAAVKRYTQSRCDYSFAQLETTVRAGLDSVSLQKIWRFCIRSKRWIITYYRDRGMGSVERQFAEKIYRSHRRAPKQLMFGQK